MSSNSIRFNHQLDLEKTEQLRVDSLGETTQALIVGMVDLYRAQKVSSVEYDSDGDSMPDLQSISGSSEEMYATDEEKDHDPFQTGADCGSDMEDPKKGLLPAKEFTCAYPYHIEDGDEKLIAIEVEEGPRSRIGQAVARKAEDILEILQPYPGDPVNILQFRGRRFNAFETTDGQILIQDKVHNMLTPID
ncbi:hypothetical protein C0993_001439 [Termitomyces sp. T159_Od127]|nr:hypothetical protein C0993_001439 [Termitomyces sp. T159_Od127]